MARSPTHQQRSFCLGRVEANEYIKLKKFKDYWEKGLPYLDEVTLKIVPDPTVRMTALRSGDLDMANWLPLEEVSTIMKRPQEGIQFTAMLWTEPLSRLQSGQTAF